MNSNRISEKYWFGVLAHFLTDALLFAMGFAVGVAVYLSYNFTHKLDRYSSGIVVGALLAVGVTLVADDNGTILARVFGFVALVFASINIFGGFLVTQRMLAMFKAKGK